MKNEIYEGIKNNKYSLQKICDIFHELVAEDDIHISYCVSLHSVIVLLLYFYNKKNITEILDYGITSRFEPLITRDLKRAKDNDCSYINDLNYIDNLNYFLNRIDLIEPINI